ncbi:baculoviral IAP repeat-containing protein 7-like [Haliotis asinina]|uniref:baculoviral IAP repeat-containing protein 7-like n=1 Tax=Haliotis asinina TaxID=109174 RepID=UPI00353274A6
MNELEKALIYRPPTDGSTGRPDESNMQNIWKVFERFLLQRFAIESQGVSTSPFITLRNYFEKLARGQAVSTEEEMMYEGLRFASFQRIKVETSSLRLAAAGFYATGSGDETRCFSCGVRYRNWETRDNPFVIHSRISPNCPHATGTDERNVPIQLPSESATVTPPTEGDDSTPVTSESERVTPMQGAIGGAINNTEERYNQIVDGTPPRQSARYSDRTLPSSSTSKLRFEDAVHPHYSNSGHRLESFRFWPEGHTHSPEDLVGAGFFYAGYSDCVRCFVCGLGLRTWEEGDDPWVEHVRWRSSCAYVEATRGKSFIVQTLAAIGRTTHTPQLNPGGIQQRSSNNRHNHDTSGEAQHSSPDILRTNACERALEMGFSRGQVMLAAQSTIASAGRQALTLPALLERILAVGSQDEAGGAEAGYSDGNSQGQHGQAGKVMLSEMGNMDSRSSSEKNNTLTRQAHLLRSPAISTESGYKSLPVENHVRQPPARQTSGDLRTGHPNTNIMYNVDIAAQESEGTEDSSTEERGKPKESNAPVTRCSSFNTSRHKIKIDKIQKTGNKKGMGREDLKATAEETRQLKESSACKICLEDPANIVFLPCGHLVACAICAPALERCPICRKHIRGTVRVHMISREKHIDHL